MVASWCLQQIKYLRAKKDFQNWDTYKVGAKGENVIKKIFKSTFKNDVYILQNLYLPKLLRGNASKVNGSDPLTEIDMVVIHRTGIYIVESKNYEGLIIGDAKLKYWQVHNDGRLRWLYNPLWQHGTHTNAIRRQIDLSAYPFHSLVIFGEDAILCDVQYEPTKHNFEVLHVAQLETFLMSTHKKTDRRKLLSKTEMKEIYKSMKKFTRITNEQFYQHSQAVLAKTKKKKKADSV